MQSDVLADVSAGVQNPPACRKYSEKSKTSSWSMIEVKWGQKRHCFVENASLCLLVALDVLSRWTLKVRTPHICVFVAFAFNSQKRVILFGVGQGAFAHKLTLQQILFRWDAITASSICA